MNDLILRFEDTDIEIIDNNGEKWMRVRTLADGLGYSHPDQLTRLIRRNKTEFEGKLFTVKLTGNSPGAPELIINYHGVIRAAMLLCSAGQTKKDRIEPELPWKGSDIFRESRLS